MGIALIQLNNCWLAYWFDEPHFQATGATAVIAIRELEALHPRPGLALT